MNIVLQKILRRMPTAAPEELKNKAPRSPLISRYTTISDWLVAWVDFRMSIPWPSGFGPRTKTPNGDALYLCGSIGFDSAISPDGTVWMNDYGHSDDDNWRIATSKERLGFLLIAQSNSYPELSVLLPLKPNDAVKCSACDGSGYMRDVIILCQSCGSRGWVTQSDD